MPGRPGGRTFFDDATDAPFDPLSDEDERRIDAETERVHRPRAYQARHDRAERERVTPRRVESTGDYGATPLDLSTPRIRDLSAVRNRRQLATGAGAGISAGAGMVSGRQPPSLAAGVLGLVAYAIAINYLRGGWPQVKGWAAAKFANVPYQSGPGAQIIPFPTTTAAATTSAVVAPGTVVT